MDIKELRFGNIVLLNNPKSWNELQKVPMKVKGIGFNPTPIGGINETITVEKLCKNKYEIHEDYSQFAQFINPIALTEEWLLKLGFKKIDHHRFKIQPSQYDWFYTYSIHDNAFRFYVEDTILCLNTIFYVHELQNLYFALVGKELVVSDAVS